MIVQWFEMRTDGITVNRVFTQIAPGIIEGYRPKGMNREKIPFIKMNEVVVVSG